MPPNRSSKIITPYRAFQIISNVVCFIPYLPSFAHWYILCIKSGHNYDNCVFKNCNVFLIDSGRSSIR